MAVTSGSLCIAPVIPYNVVWLNRIPLSANRASPGRQFLFPVLVQVLRVRVVVSICPPIKELLTRLFGTIAAVDVLGVIELFQDAVVPALLLKNDWSAAMLWVKRSHDEGIIYMAFGDVQDASSLFGFCTVCDMNFHIWIHLLYLSVHHPPNCCHERCAGERFYSWLPIPELATRFMVLWCMALVTDGDQIFHSIGTTHAAVPDMMDVKNSSVLGLPSTTLAGITITGKNCFAECGNAVPFSSLVILPFWNRGTFLYSFQNLDVELSHLHRDRGDGYHFHELFEICKILIFAMLQGRRKPIIHSPSVVKSRLPMTKS